MVPLVTLWAPIALAAVLVFVVSSLLHMVLRFHQKDWVRLPAEDDVMDALRRFKIPPGDYVLPCAGTPDHMQSTEFQDKMKRGPVALITMMESGPPSLAKPLAMWFVYSLVVGLFAGYVASRTLPAGADYRDVFRLTSTVAFAGYALALWQNSIWYKRSLGATIRSNVDGLIYALLTGGCFGWLWPR
jgi:hypothetical protein